MPWQANCMKGLNISESFTLFYAFEPCATHAGPVIDPDPTPGMACAADLGHRPLSWRLHPPVTCTVHACAWPPGRNRPMIALAHRLQHPVSCPGTCALHAADQHPRPSAVASANMSDASMKRSCGEHVSSLGACRSRMIGAGYEVTRDWHRGQSCRSIHELGNRACASARCLCSGVRLDIFHLVEMARG